MSLDEKIDIYPCVEVVEAEFGRVEPVRHHRAPVRSQVGKIL